jgi:hypothetical protein
VKKEFSPLWHRAGLVEVAKIGMKSRRLDAAMVCLRAFSTR